MDIVQFIEEQEALGSPPAAILAAIKSAYKPSPSALRQRRYRDKKRNASATEASPNHNEKRNAVTSLVTSPVTLIPPTPPIDIYNITTNTKNNKKPPNPLFQKFYAVYPRHDGKEDAIKASHGIKPSEWEAVIEGASLYAEKVGGSDPKFIALPATWLRGRRWRMRRLDRLRPANPILCLPEREAVVTVYDIIARYNIALTDFRAGNHRALCPQCSHTRKHRRDRCLSVKIDDKGVTWNCFNCGWKPEEKFLCTADSRTGRLARPYGAQGMGSKFPHVHTKADGYRRLQQAANQFWRP